MTSTRSFSHSSHYIFFLFTHGWQANKASQKGVFRRIWYKLYSHDLTSFLLEMGGTRTFVDSSRSTGIAVRAPELIQSPRKSLWLSKELVQAFCHSAAAQRSRQGATGYSGHSIPGLIPICAPSKLPIEQSPASSQHALKDKSGHSCARRTQTEGY